MIGVPVRISTKLRDLTSHSHSFSMAVYGVAAVSLKIVFFPLLAFETVILIDNFRY